MRCDLHVHSRHSGLLGLPLFGATARECYSDPYEVREVARARGMQLFTLTDHDAIDGALALARRFDDSFVSEEVTCTLPSGCVIHLGAFFVEEPQHFRIERLRADAEALFAYLAEQAIPACLNHPFSALTGRRRPADLPLAFRNLALVETRNGMLPEAVNDCARLAARVGGLGSVGGSDAHTLRSVALAYTDIPSARTKDEFRSGLRRGLTLARGRAGSYWRLAQDLASLFASGCLEAARDSRIGGLCARAVLGLAAPLYPLLPIAALVQALRETLFARRQLLDCLGGRALPMLAPGAGR
jgi:predicted metal-dependent phosphoesterase TrpH